MQRLGEGLIRQPQRLLLALGAWHLTFWVLAPMLGYAMLPLDTLEALAWGKEWQWGYYKHPPLGAWLAEIAFRVSGGRVEALYLLAQAVLLLCLYYVWKTARLSLDPVRAALATAVLGGSYFHTVLVPNFNMNTLQLPLWAGLGYHFLRALDGRRAHWWPFALFCALAILAKYSSLLIVATCGLILFATAEGRAQLRRPEPWLAGLLCLVLLGPHVLWLSEHWRLPWSYLAGFEAQGEPGLAGHVLEPLRFALAGAIALLGSAALFLTVSDRGGLWPRPQREDLILLALVLGPLLLTLLYGAIGGGRLKSTWAFPFYSLVGVLAFRLLPTRVDAARAGRFALVLAALSLLISGLHLGYKLASDRSKTAFDGRTLALAAQQAWRERFDTALPIVAGDHIHTAIVAAYAPDRPSMLIEGDFAKSSWLRPQDLARGAVLVCPAGRECPALDTATSAERIELSIDRRAFVLHILPPRR